MGTIGNHNTAQQQGASTNPFKGISSMYNAHLQHKDRVASLKQREEHFQTNSKLKAAGMLQRESHFNKRQELNRQQFNAKQDLNKQKLDLQASKHNLDITKTNHKMEMDTANFKQKQKEHEDKMGIAAANTQIKFANHKTFNDDVAGKNNTRNIHNQVMVNSFNENRKKGKIKYQESPIPKQTKQKEIKINKGRKFTPTFNTKKAKVYTLPSGTNIKGRYGNRKKGL